MVRIPRQTPDVVLRGVPACSLAQAENIVKAHIVGWDAPDYAPIPGFSSTHPFSKMTLAIDSALKGNLSGTVTVFQYMGVDSQGNSENGVYDTATNRSDVFFLLTQGDYLVVEPTGYFRFDGSKYRNNGADAAGLAEAELRAAIADAGVGPGCSDPFIAAHNRATPNPGVSVSSSSVSSPATLVGAESSGGSTGSIFGGSTGGSTGSPGN